jgi:transposase
VQIIRAVVRALKTLRAEGRPSALVFIDEYNTSKLCCRCHGEMRTPLKKIPQGRRVEDRRFRDCPHCGTQAAPRRRGRDSNAARNMLIKLSALLDGAEIPLPFCRPATT